jgi:tetratricopeptide (TPR) repeat protein
VKNHPEDVTTRNNLAVVLDMSGKTSEALDLLENSTADNPEIFKTRAMIQLKEGHLDLAGKDIESSFAKGSAGPESLHLLGILNLQRGKLSAAEESFRNIIGKYPGYYEGYLNLGLTLRRQGRFKEASVVYVEGIAATGDPDLYLNLGVLYELYLGKPERALDNYRKFIELEGAESLRINGWIGYLSGLQSVLKKKEVLSP